MTTGRLLVTYSNAATHVATTMEYLSSIKQYSRYQVSYLHVTDGADVDVDLSQFDAVFNSYCARLCFPDYVSRSYIDALKAFRGVRLLAVQDEYNRTDTVREAIREIGFHVVFTCVPPEGHQFVYPKTMYPETEFITVLTGYVPAGLKTRGRGRIPLGQRPITIGYRGREIAGYYGRLGFDKYEIGRRMREICAARGIAHDIGTSEDKRIYGDAWYDFLGQCRTTLGTESGSNVFDFDGSLERTYRLLEQQKGGALSYEEFRNYTDSHESRVEMGQISPRIFEAAATGTAMVLFSGRYSGIVEPGEHYIELKKDFSNVDSVLEQIEDLDALQALADRAHFDLVASGRYDYGPFIKLIDDTIERKREELTAASALGTAPSVQRAVQPTIGFDAGLGLKEQPTSSPRDVVFYRYKHLWAAHKTLRHEYEVLRSEFANETARLSREADYLRSEFANETRRLRAEADFLRSEFARETRRLSAEIDFFKSPRALLIILMRVVPPPLLPPLRWLRAGWRRRSWSARSR